MILVLLLSCLPWVHRLELWIRCVRSLQILLAWCGRSQVCSPTVALLLSCSTKIQTPPLCSFSYPDQMNLSPFSSPDSIHLTSTRPRISHRYLSILILSCSSFPVSRRVLTFQVPSAVVLPAWGFFQYLTFRPSPDCSAGDADLVWLGDVWARICSHYLTSHGLQSSSSLQPMYWHPFGRPYTMQGMWCVDRIHEAVSMWRQSCTKVSLQESE